MSSQNRLPLTRALADHDQRRASTLVAEQISDSITASQDWPDGKDTAMIDATDGDVVVTLPLGDDENKGLHFNIVKTDASANDATMAAPEDQEFEGGGTELTVASQHGRASAYWDGTVWRLATAAAGAGAVDVESVSTAELEVTESVTVPSGYRLPRVWTSGNVTQAAFSSGTSQSINLPAGADGAFPSNVEVISAHLELNSTVTSGNANTNSLTASLGPSSATTGYLAAGANLINASGKRENAAGTLMGSRRAADTPQITLMAAGGAPDLTHITAFSAKAIITYWPLS